MTVIVRWQQSQRAFAYELKSNYLDSTIESWKDVNDITFFFTVYVYLLSSGFPFLGSSYTKSIPWHPLKSWFHADKLFLRSFQRMLHNDTTNHTKLTMAKLSPSFLYLPVPAAWWKELSFVYLLDKDFGPEDPIASYAS